MPAPYAIADGRGLADFLTNANDQPVVLDGHNGSVGAAPTVANGAQTTGTAVAANSTDMCGSVSWTTSGSAAAGVQATVTFATAWANAPIVVLTWRGAQTLQGVLRTTVTTTTFTIDTILAPTNTTAYAVDYMVLGVPS